MADKEGYEFAVKATRTPLRFIGVWPNHHERSENWLLRSRFIVPAFFIVNFINIPQTALLINEWGNFNEVLSILVTANIPDFIALIKLLNVWYNRKVIGLLLVSMEDDWKSPKTPTESRNMWESAKIGRLITLVTYTLSSISFTIYGIMGIYISATESVQEFEITLNKSIKRRPTYVKSHFFYNVQKTPVYEIVWIFQFLAIGLSVLVFTAIDSLFTVLIWHLCGQLINLQECLKNITQKLTTTKITKFSYQLSTIVLRHIHLNRFAKAIENSFNTAFLVQILLYAIMFCLQGYQIVIIFTAGDTIKVIELIFMIALTICFMLSMFFYCYMAEILRTESTKVGSAAYQCNWYDLPVCEARLFILTMSRSTTPFEITAGKFAAFSLEFFCSILKTSGSYLSVLLAIQDKLPA